MSVKKLTIIIAVILKARLSNAQQSDSMYHEPYRPQLHFSPQAHWMNDPNGLVYFDGIYHLFFQYYPNATVWGPMHWGHATSPDMIHWKELPIALYPDSLGYIFSGSAVVDSNNSSGFGKDGKIPMVAVFTQHDPVGEKAGTNNFQNESIAYSLDNGNTWTKYSGNPVLKNPGIQDFRDPKVSWYASGHKWIMTLATKDRITFYSSPNLKDWSRESEFGATVGAHGGVWECPDLFPLKLNDKTYWVLIVNLNPGGPNGGSGTQYFVGQFDGHRFNSIDTSTRWVDYGPDEYAGITWSNTGNRKIFLGWMSNWEYANQVPTEKWRNAMTIPRELSLKGVDGNILLASEPVEELTYLKYGGLIHIPVYKSLSNISVNKSDSNIPVDKTTSHISSNTVLPNKCIVKLDLDVLDDYAVTLFNKKDNQVIIGYDKKTNQYYIDRTQSGKVNFQKDFAGKFTAPRLSTSKNADLTLIIDAASVELFADDGLTVMTAIYFPDAPLDIIKINGSPELKASLTPLKTIWP